MAGRVFPTDTARRPLRVFALGECEIAATLPDQRDEFPLFIVIEVTDRQHEFMPGVVGRIRATIGVGFSDFRVELTSLWRDRDAAIDGDRRCRHRWPELSQARGGSRHWRRQGDGADGKAAEAVLKTRDGRGRSPTNSNWIRSSTLKWPSAMPPTWGRWR